MSLSFNTQPHEGGCQQLDNKRGANKNVSTHSRTKAAALLFIKIKL